MRTIIWFIYLWYSLIKLIPKMNKVNKLGGLGKLKERDKIIEAEVRAWARSIIRVAGVKVSVSGLENIPPDKAVVFVGNHQGNFDIPLLLGYLEKPHGFVAKIETKKIPLVRTWMEYLNCIFIDRKDARQSLAALNDSAKLLERGYSIIIFPEGTRSRGKEMGEFKQGAFRMAFKNNSPIVPMAIDGTYKVMEQQGFWIRPAEVSLKILPPIDTQGMGRAESKALSDVIFEQIRSEL